MEQKRRKIKKGKVENWKWKEERLQNEERTFFFFFFVLFCFVFVFSLGFFFFSFFFFCFSLFKTTEICFGSTKMKIFYRGKAFHTGKKSGKMTLPPLKNIPLMPLLYSSVPSKAVCSKIGTALWKIGSTDFVKMCEKDVSQFLALSEAIILVQELPNFVKFCRIGPS